MTNHITKTWFDGKTVVTVTKEIPVEEVYKREWVGLTDEEWLSLGCKSVEEVRIGLAIEAKLKEKNT